MHLLEQTPDISNYLLDPIAGKPKHFLAQTPDIPQHFLDRTPCTQGTSLIQHLASNSTSYIEKPGTSQHFLDQTLSAPQHLLDPIPGIPRHILHILDQSLGTPQHSCLIRHLGHHNANFIRPLARQSISWHFLDQAPDTPRHFLDQAPDTPQHILDQTRGLPQHTCLIRGQVIQRLLDPSPSTTQHLLGQQLAYNLVLL
jgi:hypothetical protein